MCKISERTQTSFGVCAWSRDITSYLALVFLHIYLIAENNERKVLWVVWAGLNEELVSPAVERFKRLGTVHIVNEDATVGSTIERDAERLEALLTSRIPKLRNEDIPA